MQLTKVQKKAVDKIYDFFLNKEKFVDFQAPTGSGKTFMIAHLASKIFQFSGEKKTIILLNTLSSSALPLQFYQKILQYQKYLPFSYQAVHKDAPSKVIFQKLKDYTPNLLPQDKTFMIVGKSSFTKSSIFLTRELFPVFLDTIHSENYQLIYIRDEAHYGDKKDLSTNKQSKEGFVFEKTIQDNAHFVLKMTATANLSPHHQQVIIEEEDLLEGKEKLLKTEAIVNQGINGTLKTIDNFQFLKIAIQKFQQIQKDYQSLNINPALLLQVDSRSQKNSSFFDQDISKIIAILEKYNLGWVQYFSGNDKKSNLKTSINLMEISDNNSPVDVIIFKIGPATGWDIPRACMLVQLRNVSSEILNKQTLGRIKRNPLPDLSYHHIVQKYYLYSNYQESTRNMHKYLLQKQYFDTIWIQGKIKITTNDQNVAANLYVQAVEKKFHQQKKDWQRWVKELKNQIQKEQFLISEQVTLTSKNNKIYLVKKIFNALELKIFLKEKKIYCSHLFTPLQVFLLNIQKKYQLASLEQVCYLIITHFLSELKNLYKKIYQKSLVSQHLLQEKVFLPKEYNIWEAKLPSKQHYSSFEELKTFYAYINSQKKWKYQQFLDSNNEIIFFQDIVKEIKKQKFFTNIKVWSKNAALVSNLYLQYLDENFLIQKAYIDFVFKIKNCYWYIEIKSQTNDYDQIKTKKILTSMKAYAQNINNKKYQFVFSIIKVNNSNFLNVSYQTFNYCNYPGISKTQRFDEVLEILISS